MQTAQYHKLYLINSKKSIVTSRRSRYKWRYSLQAIFAFCLLFVLSIGLCYGLLFCDQLPLREAEALQAHTNRIQFSSAATMRHFTAPSFDALCQTQLNLQNGSILLPLLVPRQVGSPAHGLVLDFIASHFERLGWYVLLDAFVANTPVGPTNFTNLIAFKNLKASSYVAIGAHYDAKSLTPQGNQTAKFIGATDSALSCALLMHLAECLDTSLSPDGSPEERSIQFIFFDGEEAFKEWSATDSLYGSRHLAAVYKSKPGSLAAATLKPRWPSTKLTAAALAVPTHLLKYDKISLFILIDLLGGAEPTLFDLHAATSLYFQHLVQLESVLRMPASRSPFERKILETRRSFTYNISEFDLNVEDDHLPFMHLGVPILQLMPLPYPDVWHTPRDDVTALDEPTVRDWSRLLRLFLVDLLRLVPLPVPPAGHD